ncbi:tetratricopeptide repeat protein [Micromonosporaceae bacterium B7E4]
MSVLTLPRVTYLGGHPDRTDQSARLTVVLDRSGIVVRGRFRRFLEFRWPDLRGLDVRSPDIVTFVLSTSLSEVDADGTTLHLRTDRGLARLHVNGVRQADLRAALAGWVIREAGPDVPLPATPPPAPRQVDGQLGTVRMALDVWRAASLGREPLADRSTLAYRLAVAENHRFGGAFTEAVAVLGPLAAEAARAFGPTDDDTLKVRNALGQTYLAAGAVDDGLDVLRELVAVTEHLHGVDGELTLVFRNNLAAGYQQAGQYALAIDLHGQNVRHTERRRGPADLETIGRRNNLAATLALAGQRERAITGYWAVLDALAGADHALGVTARQNLAILHNPSWRP